MGRRRKPRREPSVTPAPPRQPAELPRPRAWPAIVNLPIVIAVIAVTLSVLFPDVPLSIPALAGLMICVSVVWATIAWLRRVVRARQSTRLDR